VPKTNFKYEKRQKDIEKKKKRDQKIQRRQAKKALQPVENLASTPEINQLLEQVDNDIQNAQNVDEKGQELLRQTSADIRDLLERSGSSSLTPHPSMIERLEESIEHLEATHPDLTKTLTDVLNVLSNAGI
jgi:molecular chaperone GrpE (heat shock protein)